MILIYDEARSPDIYYRCGWNSEVEVLYREDENGTRTVYVPGFEYLRAKKEVSGVRVERLENPVELVKTFTGPFVVPNRFPHMLGKSLVGEAVCKKELFLERRRKNDAELAHIKHAQDAARAAIGAVITVLESACIEQGVAVVDGSVVTSEQLKLLARSVLIEHGYDCADMIISSGKQTALPHHRGSGEIMEGPVIIDIFPRSEKTLYWGDMTRTIIVGTHERAEKMLSAVKTVHDVCVSKCVVGMKCSALHELAVSELEKHGFATGDEEGLIHSLGHSIGLAIHEAPGLSPKDETVLEEGMVVTIEPGLYYDVGVRWENIIVIGNIPKTL